MRHLFIRLLLLLPIAFLATSCVTKQYRNQPVSVFMPLDQPALFEGTYLNENGVLVEMLYLAKKKGREIADDIDFVTLTWDGKDHLIASVTTEKGPFTYRVKREKNAPYFQKSSTLLIPFPPLYMQHDYRQIRLGTDSISDLLLYYWHRGGGMVLLVAGGGADQRDYRFNRFDPQNSDVWYPCKEGDKWGYKRGNRWMISPQYEYARLFQDDLARVKQNGKWGILRKDGKMLTPFQYDRIDPFYIHPYGGVIGIDPPADKYDPEVYIIAKAYRNGKEGYIDNEGKECIPVRYETIRYFDDGVAKARLNGRKVTVTYRK